MWEVAPNIHKRISLLALPPSTLLSCTSTTFNPCRAAVMELHTPDRPPPVTIKSASSFTSGKERFSVLSDLIMAI
jgi:hypothetical protein